MQRDRENGGDLDAQMKNPRDSRSYLTVADGQAQRVILNGLRREWPDLLIVAEEDEDAAADTAADGNVEMDVSKSRCSDLEVSADLQSLTLADVCLFVDPLDGTREFVEGRLESVQSLIGISVRGRSVAGVMGLPFHNANCKRDLGVRVRPLVPHSYLVRSAGAGIYIHPLM